VSREAQGGQRAKSKNGAWKKKKVCYHLQRGAKGVVKKSQAGGEKKNGKGFGPSFLKKLTNTNRGGRKRKKGTES